MAKIRLEILSIFISVIFYHLRNQCDVLDFKKKSDFRAPVSTYDLDKALDQEFLWIFAIARKRIHRLTPADYAHADFRAIVALVG